MFSTYVEMILWFNCNPSGPFRVLHVCGDDPHISSFYSLTLRCSPRMWRWSQISIKVIALPWVFSTYVEMILAITLRILFQLSVLHVCGDDPRQVGLQTVQRSCSPRMWRWSYIFVVVYFLPIVFSTYVEMILKTYTNEGMTVCVLHVCGDDPKFRSIFTNANQCSPRMWRWSCSFLNIFQIERVFSTYVEMIPLGAKRYIYDIGVLHVCGDDPG